MVSAKQLLSAIEAALLAQTPPTAAPEGRTDARHPAISPLPQSTTLLPDEYRGNNTNMATSHVEGQKGEGRSSYRPGYASSNIPRRSSARSYSSPDENESVSASDEDTIAELLEQHDAFVGSMRSRLGKLQALKASDRAQVQSKEVKLPDAAPISLDDQDVHIVSFRVLPSPSVFSQLP